MSTTMSAEVTFRVDGFTAGGEGVGRLEDGRVAFVHRTAPGDLVVAELREAHPRWVRARLLTVVEPSSLRREPPCGLYARCGGCTLQHVTYQAQLRAKAEVVSAALRRIGGVAVPAPEVTASPLELGYRNRLSFALRRLGGGRVVAGFHELSEANRLVDVGGQCLLPQPVVLRAWTSLRDAWGEGARLLPPGRDLRLTIRAAGPEEAVLVVENGRYGGNAQALLAAVPHIIAIWARRGHGRAHLLAGSGEETPGGDAEESAGTTAFTQVNPGAAALVQDHVLACAGDVAGSAIVEGYCGIGSLARELARRGARVTGIELDEQAVRMARRNAPPGLVIAEGRVERLLEGVLPTDLVILDPPRTGVAPEAAGALVAAPPPRVIMVSCDAATLARDVARLAAAFEVESLRCFDLFPQTAHVETVAVLRRRGASPTPRTA